MRRILSILLLAAMLSLMLLGCTSKTPDVVESEAKEVKLEDVNWTIPITIEATGETKDYTIDMAKQHELTKTYVSGYTGYGQAYDAPQVSTFILEGVLFSEVLADLGVTDCSGITINHSNGDIYEYDKELVLDAGTVLGWIQNKSQIVAASEPTYVGFGAKEGGVHDFCHSIKDITIHP